MKPEKPSKKAPSAAAKKKNLPSAAKPKRAAAPKPAKAPLKVPAILLEGDAPSQPSVGGPGQRYALGPTPPHEPAASGDSGELPEAYGTGQLLLTARDPHWLYAHWDLTQTQIQAYNRKSADGHLVLRVFTGALKGSPQSEIHVHPESRNWFIHVPSAGERYFAELGYYEGARKWVQVSKSRATLTPPEALSEDTSVRFATIPVEVPFEELLRLVKLAVRENVPLAEAILQLRAEGYTNLPGKADLRSETWSAAQEKALAQIISMDSVRRVWMGSLEITELIRRQLLDEISSAGAAQFSIPTSPGGAVSSISSAFGGMERRKSFWFNVNAELIIYGATESDARVTIGGRAIRLRPDGTFSFRFVLPDGQYDLPAVAISADGDDSRSAALRFSRATDYSGEVGAHPQDSALKPPLPAHVA